MRLFFVLSLFLTFFNLNTTKAQSDFRPGYVITIANDTLRGLIDYRGDYRNAKRCDFKENETSAVKVFLPSDLKAFRFNDSKYYLSKTVVVNEEKMELFLEFLVNGIADLYYYRDGTVSHYFIEKSDGEIFELTDEQEEIHKDGKTFLRDKNNYIGSLRYAFSDCPQLFPTINESYLETKSLINITKKYHNYVCDDEKCIIYEKQLPAIKLSFAPYLSLNGSFFSFSNSAHFEAYKFQMSNYPSIGIQINTTLPGVNEKLSLQITGDISKPYFYGNRNIIFSNNSSVFQELHFHITPVKGKAGLKYTFPKGKLRPTIMAGANVIYLLQKEGKKFQDNVDTQSLIYLHQYEADYLPDFFAGYNIDLGCNYYFSDKLTTFFNIGYSNSQGVKKSTEINTYIEGNGGLANQLSTFNLSAGIYF